MNNAVVNIFLHIFVRTKGFISLGISGSHGKLMFNLLRNCHCFPKWLYILHSHQQCYEGSSFSTSLPTLGIDFLYDYSHPSGFEVVARCGFNLTNDVEYLPKRFLVVTS